MYILSRTLSHDPFLVLDATMVRSMMQFTKYTYNSSKIHQICIMNSDMTDSAVLDYIARTTMISYLAILCVLKGHMNRRFKFIMIHPSAGFSGVIFYTFICYNEKRMNETIDMQHFRN